LARSPNLSSPCTSAGSDDVASSCCETLALHKHRPTRATEDSAEVDCMLAEVFEESDDVG
ncbi:hypothetical protein Dimus_029056, partial [Dionaea muscipula]